MKARNVKLVAYANLTRSVIQEPTTTTSYFAPSPAILKSRFLFRLSLERGEEEGVSQTGNLRESALGRKTGGDRKLGRNSFNPLTFCSRSFVASLSRWNWDDRRCCRVVADVQIKWLHLNFRWNDRGIMPLYDVIGLGGEKHAVVIDVGAAYTK